MAKRQSQQLSRDEVIQLMKERQGSRTNKDFAEELGISGTYLGRVYQGKDDPGDSILSKLNLQRRIVYEPLEGAA